MAWRLAGGIMDVQHTASDIVGWLNDIKDDNSSGTSRGIPKVENHNSSRASQKIFFVPRMNEGDMTPCIKTPLM